jgi:hypothetical protein
MIFKSLGDKLSQLIPAPFLKPLFTCLPCMGGFYGLTMWIISSGSDQISSVEWFVLSFIPAPALGLIPSVLCCIGANSLLSLALSHIKSMQILAEYQELRYMDDQSYINEN